ncbi:hypothetical protein NDN01_15410 [Sphingomonas sp. QA11]|uniref:hypothetical protein n=1 Tax=Sphingomonas sp. QA11 TaxID=2950605 RepID=UPI0023490754|nr:hypothetical protein [Sphingomonas sp. QA11]WCM25442.1 hypothetical protein NDN01_15410 [Sphingomonas sp. QA11]
MAAREFVKACKEERDTLLALYADQNLGSAVGAHLDAAKLTQQQRAEVIAALDTALTDTFYTLLMGLAGAGTLGGSQQVYRLSDEHSRPITLSGNDDLEALAFEIFQSEGR